MKEQEFRIPLLEKVPKGYRRKFVLDLPAGRQEIEVRGRQWLVYRQRGGVGRHNGDSLDWIQECVERIRGELEELAQK